MTEPTNNTPPMPERVGDGSNCFVCSPTNPLGLGVRFERQGTECRGEFTPGANHCGFDGITHGGLIFALLDDAMGYCVYRPGERCFTARCQTKFAAHWPIGTRGILLGQEISRRRNIVTTRGEARRADTGELIAECEAKFVIKQTSTLDSDATSNGEAQPEPDAP